MRYDDQMHTPWIEEDEADWEEYQAERAKADALEPTLPAWNGNADLLHNGESATERLCRLAMGGSDD
jgi:hypothetical protein